MARARSPKRDRALQLWLESGRTRLLKDIAAELEVSEEQVRKWKNQDNWGNSNVTIRNGNVTKRKQGGQYGNKNASGSPPRNRRAEKYGFFSRFLPDETREIVDAIEEVEPLELLWHQIQLSYAAIIRAQQIGYVKDREDKTKEQTMTGDADAFEVQQAWDKQSNFMKAQARAQDSLRGLIRQYDEMLHANWEAASEEQRARIEQIRANTERLRRGPEVSDDDGVVIINDAEQKTGQNQ